MAEFLVLEDYVSHPYSIKAGEIIDDRYIPVANLRAKRGLAAAEWVEPLKSGFAGQLEGYRDYRGSWPVNSAPDGDLLGLFSTWQFEHLHPAPPPESGDRVGSAQWNGADTVQTLLNDTYAALDVGALASGQESDFTVSAQGALTYTGLSTMKSMVRASVTLKRPSGGVNGLVEVALYKNGSIVPGYSTQKLALATINNPVSLSMNGVIPVATGDVLQLFNRKLNSGSVAVVTTGFAFTAHGVG